MSGPHCPACRSPRSRRAFSAAGVTWLRCRECLTLFDADPPAPEALEAGYGGRDYFVKAAPGEGSDTLWGYADDYLSDRANIEAKFDRVLARIEQNVAPERLLDIGCGPGFLLSAAERRGWSGVGVDLNDWAVAHAREELGLDVRLGAVEAQGFADGEFGVVTMMDLIEHVSDPGAVLSEAARLVRPGGAIALLTPDAASPVSRLLGRRWPEVRRPGEHIVLFSAEGLARLLDEHGFTPAGRHSVGKEAPLETLVADAAPLAPRVAERVHDAIAGTAAGRRAIDLDPRTKLVMYGRRRPSGGGRLASHRAPRVSKNPAQGADVETAILEELGHLAQADRLCTWMFDQFRPLVGPDVVEVGAGIGTFTERLLDAGAQRVLAIEPEPSCAGELERRFGGDQRVTVVRDELPTSPALAERAGSADFVLCQNVLEHIGDDLGAVRAMGEALRPGGALGLLVPAAPMLYGPLDSAYGHWRRYRHDELRMLLVRAGLELESLRRFNALGVAGWWTKNLRPSARVGPRALAAYEALVRVTRPIEDRLPMPVGLSLVAIARRPAEGAPPPAG